MRPLAENPELQIHARGELREKIVPGTEDDASWNEAAETLERHDRSWLRRRWRTLLLVATFVVTALCFAPTVIVFFQNRFLFNSLFGSPFSTSWSQESKRVYYGSLSEHLSPDQRLILFGDLSKSRKSDRLEALCRRYPDNPVYYADYAATYWLERQKLPPDFLATAARIDPGNGWFLTLAAGATAKDVVEADKQTAKERKDRVPKKWKLLDEPRLNDSLALLRAANRLPRFHSYQDKRAREQLALFPPTTDLTTRLQRMAFSSSRSYAAFTIKNLSNALSAQSQQLADREDREAFQLLLADWQTLMTRQPRTGMSLIDQLIAQSSMKDPGRNFKEGATRLGLDQEAARLQEVLNRLEANDAYRSQWKSSLQEGSLKNHGSLLLGLTLPMFERQVRNPPPIEEDALTPGRLTDHAVGGRIFSILAWPIIGIICGLCAIYRFRNGFLIRRILGRFPALLKPVDWLWMFLAGGLLPLLYHQAIYHLTPLGGRDWSYRYTALILPYFQTITWVTLVVITPIVIARWRLQTRFASFDLEIPKPAIRTTILVFGYCALPLSGLLYLFSPNADAYLNVDRLSDPDYQNSIRPAWAFIVTLSTLALGIPLLWWISMGLRALFGTRSRALGRQVIARLLVPSYLFSLILTALMAPINHLQERHWAVRDTSLDSGPEAVEVTSYQEDITRIKKAELLEMFAPLSESR